MDGFGTAEQAIVAVMRRYQGQYEEISNRYAKYQMKSLMETAVRSGKSWLKGFSASKAAFAA